MLKAKITKTVINDNASEANYIEWDLKNGNTIVVADLVTGGDMTSTEAELLVKIQEVIDNYGSNN